jgi:hypothetical protein
MSKTDDFIKGQKDCKDGKQHESGKSKDYDRGYGFQYELEQKEGVRNEFK